LNNDFLNNPIQIDMDTQFLFTFRVNSFLYLHLQLHNFNPDTKVSKQVQWIFKTTCIPFRSHFNSQIHFSTWLPQIKTQIHRPLLSKKPIKSHSHFNILPHTIPYGVSFATLGANASLYICKIIDLRLKPVCKIDHL